MKVRILNDAEQDLTDGILFYDAQSPGLGEYFLDSISADIDSLQFYGGIRPVRLGYHYLLATKFPFAIYYRIERRVVYVEAVLDCRRNPDWIENRLK